MSVPSLRALALVAATATATTFLVNPPQVTAQTPPPVAPAPQLVVGLPDFTGLVPNDALAPFSLVCKAVSANGRPTVKLSDNPNKAMGPAEEIARYKRIFGVGAQEAIPVTV